MKLAAIDTAAAVDDFQDFVADNPLAVYAGATVLILLLIGSLYIARLRASDRPEKPQKQKAKSSGGSFQLRRKSADGDEAQEPYRRPRLSPRGGGHAT